MEVEKTEKIIDWKTYGKPNARNNCPTWGWQSLRPAGVCCTHKHGDVSSRGNNQTCELSNPNWMVSDPSNDSKKLRVPSPDPKGAPKALMVEILLTKTRSDTKIIVHWVNKRTSLDLVGVLECQPWFILKVG